MVMPVMNKNGNDDFNDPVRKQLIEAKRKHAAQQKRDYSHVFTRKSLFDIVRLNFIMMGLEFAYAAETAFVSPILLKIGIDHSKMTMVWSLSPILGFFLAPVMGSFSDKCRNPIGRRRPFIIMLSIGVVLGLILVPFGKDFGAMCGDYGDQVNITENNSFSNMTLVTLEHNPQSDAKTEEDMVFESYKWAVLFTVIGTILLDFDADNCLTPVRAYILDVILPEDNTRAFSMSTVMAGIGAGLGYLMGAIDWSTMSIGRLLGGNIKTVFVVVLIIFVISAIVTLTSFPEIPLPLMENDDMLKPLTNLQVKDEKKKRKTYNSLDIKTEVILNVKDLNGNASVTLNGYQDIEGNNPEAADEEEHVSFWMYLKSIIMMPPALRLLCLTNYFAWMAHSCYILYFTDFVGEAVFHGDPTSNHETTEYQLYNDGVRFGCYGMAVYALTVVVYSLVFEKLINKFGGKFMYTGAITLFSAGMLVLAVYPIKTFVLLLSTTVGVFYATQFNFPILLVARYHSKGSFKVKRGQEIASTEKRGLALDIAIVSSMLFVAQFTVSLSIGSFIELIGSTTAVMYAASFFAACAAISAMKIVYMGA